jgi:hypothetical protein
MAPRLSSFLGWAGPLLGLLHDLDWLWCSRHDGVSPIDMLQLDTREFKYLSTPFGIIENPFYAPSA